MLNEVIVVVPTVEESVFENVYFNSSVKNSGNFKLVTAFIVWVTLCTVLLMIRLIVDRKEKVACFDEG